MMKTSVPTQNNLLDGLVINDIEIGYKTEIIDRSEKEVPYAMSIKGFESRKIVYPMLHFVCVKLDIQGYKNKSKEFVLKRLAQSKLNNSAYSTLATTFPLSRKQAQCPFRLLNILFSKNFAARFGNLGQKFTHIELDTGQTNDSKFWDDVHPAFIDPETEHVDLIQCHHSEIDKTQIDPGIIVKHSKKKLVGIYKDCNIEFRNSMARYTVSGNHKDDFYLYCRGKLDALY